MPYQQLIPRPTDQLNNSQGDIQANFLEIYNWVAINHAQFDTANAGKHTQVTFPINVAPTPTALNEVNMYSRTSANTNQPEITWQRQNNTLPIIEMTAQRNFGVPNLGWTRLPSGILLKWGSGEITAFLTPTLVAYPLNINGVVAPVFNTVFNVFLTPSLTFGASVIFLDGDIALNATDFTAVGASVQFAATVPWNFYYLAIGI